MKVCKFCNSEYKQDLTKCPNCGAIEYKHHCENCGTNFESQHCPTCGKGVEEEMKICPKCTKKTFSQYCPSCGTDLNVKTAPQYKMPENIPTLNQKKCDKWVAFWLCFFLGYLGAHKFYEGKVGLGVVYLFTFGIFGFGWIYDCIRIFMKPDLYYVEK